ncbi:MAG: hypothetical protein JNN01_09765 [Opitutaceae bacterium]|nr:hypothetical protein [Opitutaceae bacterium]
MIESLGAAVDTGYLAKMIACDEKEEVLVSATYSAFITLIGKRELPKEGLRFPVRLAERRSDGFIISRGYYVSLNELRGFEIFVPKDCVLEHDGILISSVSLSVGSEDSKQGFTLLVLRRNEPNQHGLPTSPSGRGSP